MEVNGALWERLTKITPAPAQGGKKTFFGADGGEAEKKKERNCYKCKQPGHHQQDCPTKDQGAKAGNHNAGKKQNNQLVGMVRDINLST